MVRNLFSEIEEKELIKLIKNLDAREYIYEKNRIIFNNLNSKKEIGIIIDGTANMEKYDYNGNKTIIEKLEKNSIFGEIFSYYGDLSIISTSKCKVLMIEYDNLMKNLKNITLVNNIINILSNKILELNIRIEILSKRSIKDKLLTYILNLSKDNPNNICNLPFTYTDLADYLSIDRSAMMREIKKLKEDGFIKTYGRKIKLIKY